MESIIGRFFGAVEIQRIQFGLPRLDEWGSDLLVPFKARQLRCACVSWINRRWFLERDIDVTDAAVEQRVSEWLIAEFGYAAPGIQDPADAFTSKARTLYADRYGSTGGKSVHGGSGRAATIGCFQAKGIGVTPLVGIGANSVHSHGCLSVEEGIREIIYAELVAAEFPHGAIPIIALLETGLHVSGVMAGGARGHSVRRAIVVRPAALRLAHAERAPMFNASIAGYKNSQLDDARRTKDFVQRWMAGINKGYDQRNALPEVNDLVCRLAEQAAFGQVHRLFNGGYFSSNLSVDGALLDFGAMRSLPNWSNARTLDQVAGFGEELRILAKVI